MNQHLALMMAENLENHPGITFLSGGIDRSDGPTEATGVVVESDTSKNTLFLSLDMNQYISNCDSCHFSKKEGGLIITGPTQTNVMDLMVVLLDQ